MWLMSDASPERGSLGRDLRRLRKSRGLRIADLAALTNRSTGWISQVERDRSQPGYADLVAIAQAFDLPLSQLFLRDAEPIPEAGNVLRAGQRRPLPADNTGAIDDLLAPLVHGIQFYRSTLDAHSASDLPSRRGGVEMGYVLEGRFEIRIGGRHHALGPGDSFWARGEEISWLNPHDTPCTVVWLLAPLRDDPDA
ncbi:MAG: helix-turn-helix domain-containing protein [Limimaricola soesokkakensis]|uniref:helix-turn-helix domain-containing protein n=2 Tax=Limimaricola soesokkakensis TaxID=1343159 RepID=UPI004057F8C1